MSQPFFRALAVASKAVHHRELTEASKPFFAQLGAEYNFAVDVTDDYETINPDNLANYQVFVMFNLAPFDMNAEQQAALQAFIESGKGWIGIHAAGLTGKQFSGAGAPHWDWFDAYFGGVTYMPHPRYQTGRAIVEDHTHPVTRNLPPTFELGDEWYEFNESPRGRVRVLATADESTYQQNRPMGDHPIIWTNEAYRRMIYIALGHDSQALENPAYVTLLRDALLWAAS